MVSKQGQWVGLALYPHRNNPDAWFFTSDVVAISGVASSTALKHLAQLVVDGVAERRVYTFTSHSDEGRPHPVRCYLWRQTDRTLATEKTDHA